MSFILESNGQTFCDWRFMITPTCESSEFFFRTQVYSVASFGLQIFLALTCICLRRFGLKESIQSFTSGINGALICLLVAFMCKDERKNAKKNVMKRKDRLRKKIFEPDPPFSSDPFLSFFHRLDHPRSNRSLCPESSGGRDHVGNNQSYALHPGRCHARNFVCFPFSSFFFLLPLPLLPSSSKFPHILESAPSPRSSIRQKTKTPLPRPEFSPSELSTSC